MLGAAAALRGAGMEQPLGAPSRKGERGPSCLHFCCDCLGLCSTRIGVLLDPVEAQGHVYGSGVHQVLSHSLRA